MPFSRLALDYKQQFCRPEVLNWAIQCLAIATKLDAEHKVATEIIEADMILEKEGNAVSSIVEVGSVEALSRSVTNHTILPFKSGNTIK